jgi:toxin ParE1/3/4
VKPLIIAEEAEHELAGSVAFYENRKSGLGLDFERAAQQVLKKIASSPDRWPTDKYGTRHYLMQRFPFVVHYLDMPDRIWIVAFAHTRRKPNYWKTRVPWAR